MRILCTPDFMSHFGSPEAYHAAMPGIVAQLEACGMNKAEAYDLYEQGPSEIFYYFQEHPHAVCSEWLLNMVKPEKTIYNRIGEAFAYGTECRCCLGFRIAFAVAAWPVFYLLGRFL